MFYTSCHIFKFYFSFPCIPGYCPHQENSQSRIANQGQNAENGIEVAGDATTAMYVFLCKCHWFLTSKHFRNSSDKLVISVQPSPLNLCLVTHHVIPKIEVTPPEEDVIHRFRVTNDLSEFEDLFFPRQINQSTIKRSCYSQLVHSLSCSWLKQCAHILLPAHLGMCILFYFVAVHEYERIDDPRLFINVFYTLC